MAFKERIDSITELKSWTDEIPLRYKYTAGVAGQKFMQGLKQGKLVGSKCNLCGSVYLPPKTYCINCYVKIEEYVELSQQGKVAAVAFQPCKDKGYCFVVYDRVKGGLIHKLSARVAIGSIVRPVFKPEAEREGKITDILYFEALH